MTAKLVSPIEALVKAAKGQALDDEERARSEIEAAIGTYNAGALYALVHEDQTKLREAEKVLEPILGHLRKLHERLEAMEPGHWVSWQWIAADAYCEIPEAREDLDRWNIDLAKKYAGTDWDLSDYVKTEVDQVGRDLGELCSTVAKVEPRLRAVFDAMTTTKGKEGRPALGARNSLFRKLRAIYERDTGKKATAKVEPSELGAYGLFVDFVVAVNRETHTPLPKAGLGTAVRNFLYPPKTKGSKRV